jgi:hypothetical protein
MAHFARLEDNVVVDIHVVENHNLHGENSIELEQLGVNYLKSIWGEHNFVQCSYNGRIRKQYPGIGFTYDSAKDLFIAPQPYPSWTLDENSDWVCPVAEPVTELPFIAIWNEEKVDWDIVDVTLQTR